MEADITLLDITIIMVNYNNNRVINIKTFFLILVIQKASHKIARTIIVNNKKILK